MWNSIHFRLTNNDVLVKVSMFWDRKCLDLWGTRTPNLRIHAKCSNHLNYQGQTFAVPDAEGKYISKISVSYATSILRKLYMAI